MLTSDFIVKKTPIRHKFVKEHFIFVKEFNPILAKQVLDECRSQFAVFSTQRTSVIPYGRGNTERTFVTVHYRSKHLLLRPYEHDSGVQNPITEGDLKWILHRNFEDTEQL